MWDKSPELFADVVTKAAAKRVKDIATDMHTALVDKMPIDTTQAVSNVNLSLDTPNWTFVKGKMIGRAGAMAEGMSVINAMPTDKLHSVFLTSAVPYMKYLEAGWSLQAPNGVFTVVYYGVTAWYK